MNAAQVRQRIEGVGGNMSVRDEGAGLCFTVNPYGLNYFDARAVLSRAGLRIVSTFPDNPKRAINSYKLIVKP